MDAAKDYLKLSGRLVDYFTHVKEAQRAKQLFQREAEEDEDVAKQIIQFEDFTGARILDKNFRDKFLGIKGKGILVSDDPFSPASQPATKRQRVSFGQDTATPEGKRIVPPSEKPPQEPGQGIKATTPAQLLKKQEQKIKAKLDKLELEKGREGEKFPEAKAKAMEELAAQGEKLKQERMALQKK